MWFSFLLDFGIFLQKLKITSKKTHLMKVAFLFCFLSLCFCSLMKCVSHFAVFFFFQFSLWLLIDHFTVVCIVSWSWNENYAGADLVLNRNLTAFVMQIPANKHENSIISIRKAGKFLSQKGQPQPHFD